jgi:hypothetical protein
VTIVRPKLILRNGPLGRALFFAHTPQLEVWPTKVATPDPGFVLFVAADFTDIADAVLKEFALKLLEQGAVYVCAWGRDCRRAHLRFDEADIERNPYLDVLTVDGEGESLDEALWFALFHAWPSGRYESRCNSLLAIAVDACGSPIEQRLAAPDRLEADLDLLD